MSHRAHQTGHGSARQSRVCVQRNHVPHAWHNLRRAPADRHERSGGRSRARAGSAHAAFRVSAPTPSISVRSHSRGACDETIESGRHRRRLAMSLVQRRRFPPMLPLTVRRRPAQSPSVHPPSRSAMRIEDRHPDSPDSESPIAPLAPSRIPAKSKALASLPWCENLPARPREIPCAVTCEGQANQSRPG